MKSNIFFEHDCVRVVRNKLHKKLYKKCIRNGYSFYLASFLIASSFIYAKRFIHYLYLKCFDELSQ